MGGPASHFGDHLGVAKRIRVKGLIEAAQVLRGGPHFTLKVDDLNIDIINNLILGNSKRIVEVKKIIRRVSEPDITVLVRGESGTGKELAAQAVYRCSKRKNKPFVKVLCAAIPEGLLESWKSSGGASGVEVENFALLFTPSLMSMPKDDCMNILKFGS